jgi:hypothetical protein
MKINRRYRYHLTVTFDLKSPAAAQVDWEHQSIDSVARLAVSVVPLGSRLDNPLLLLLGKTPAGLIAKT